MAISKESDEPYQVQDTLDATAKLVIGGTVSGLFLAAVRNARTPGSGFMGVFTRHGIVIGLCGMGPCLPLIFLNPMEREPSCTILWSVMNVCGALADCGIWASGYDTLCVSAAGPSAYGFFSRTMMNLREKDDSWAAAFGGFMCGVVLGLPSRRMPVVIGLGSGIALLQGSLHFLGGRIDSFKKEDDEFERKEILRRTTRVPVEQTIAEIGEGGSIKPPGFEERRRNRLKEKYGIDINPVQVTVDGSL